MPCITDVPAEADVALQLLHMSAPTLPATTFSPTRETTQNDEINKHLLKTFLEYINTENVLTPFSVYSSQKQDQEADDFDD